MTPSFFGSNPAQLQAGPRKGLRPLASAYAHDWRRAGLSDHSALVVDLGR